jgi:hypothetical protein
MNLHDLLCCLRDRNRHLLVDLKSFADVDSTLRVPDMIMSAEMGVPEPCMTRIS